MTDAPGPAQPKFQYQRIADQLRAAIAEGRHRAGERLPGEDALAKEYGVGAVTIQRAVELLKNDGFLAGRRGSGVYVQDLQLLRRHGTPRRTDDQWAAGPRIWPANETQRPTIDQVEVNEEPAPSSVAAVLGLHDKEAALVCDCRFLVDGRPVKLVRTYLPTRLSRGGTVARADSAPGDLQSMLAELGLHPEHIREEVRGRAPSSEEANRLGIPIGRFVLEAYRVAIDGNGQAIGVEQTTMDSASYVVEYAYEL
ncbi:GntR family transcriptional regulator [Streptomyces sp. NPDC055912]|uniref:GntR family transcriptional regulator n=1 Tax=Streptomyces sp. NPDC055912 TaxID=3345660 RepID=UPI0035DEBE89